MSISYKEIIARLSSYRNALCLTQQKMAPLLGIGQSHYSKTECGESIISHHSLMQMYQNHLDVDFIITGIHSSEAPIDKYIKECPPMHDYVQKYMVFHTQR